MEFVWRKAAAEEPIRLGLGNAAVKEEEEEEMRLGLDCFRRGRCLEV